MKPVLVCRALLRHFVPPRAAPGPLAAQSTPAQERHHDVPPDSPDGRPDLQGLWMKSAGGFQGLFIGSLDGTNFAAGGGGGGAGAEVARPVRGTNTRLRPRPRGRTAYGAATKIPRRAATCLAFREHSISPPVSTRCRSSRTRSTWRCSTKPCTTSASFPLTTARIRRTTGRGTATRAAAGKATRWSWTSATSTAGPGWTWPGNFVDENEHVLERFTLVDRRHDPLRSHRSPTRPSSSSRSRCGSR